MSYKIIKICRRCKEKFFAGKGQSKKSLCESCQEKVNKENEALDDEEEEF